MTLKSPIYMIAALTVLHLLPRPLHHASPLEEIEADIRAIEQDILRMLAEVTASTSTGK